MGRTGTLLLALAPYAGCILVDGWMHERARRVPRLERALHLTAAVAVVAFLAGVFRGSDVLAWIGLGVLLPVAAWDEIGWHGTIAQRERVLHFVSYAALGAFVIAWRLVGAAP